jgi:filamentous hemagglutinin family protein
MRAWKNRMLLIMAGILFCHFRRMPPGLILLLAWLTSQPSANANPTGGAVTQGTATINGQGSSQVTINQSSGIAYLNWQSFNVNPGETTTFNQPSSSSIAWNYIAGGSASSINGTVNANGYVILQNPNGFTVGGQAALTAHGLVMTTASTPNLNLSSAGPWSFDAPPPTAKIVNYGKINITGGGSAYLIASDIENNGIISAPNGNIGLYAGETVLVSMSPDGRGLSAQVTLPQGSVDNNGNLIADAGSIVAQAQMVNQNGLVQANSVQKVNGAIELVASDSVNLESSSKISAQGDSTATGSPGGSVTIQGGNSISDQAGSTINVAGGTQGGNSGQVTISAPQMSALNTVISGQAAAGSANASLFINTADIALNSDGALVPGALALNVNSLSSGFSQLNLQASDDITLSAPWTLAPQSGVVGAVSLLAGNAISVNAGAKIEADGGNITLNAPTVNQDGTLQANSIGNINGVVEVDASQNLILGNQSVISANGDAAATTTPSPGGFVVLNAGNSYSDASGSTISVSGNTYTQNGITAYGQGGIVEIFDPQAGATPIQTTVSGFFAYLVNPGDIYFNNTATAVATSSTQSANSNPNQNDQNWTWANLYTSDLSAYSQIDLRALNNIELSAAPITPANATPAWTLANPGATTALSLTAGNSIILDPESGINAGQNWSVNLTAGTAFVPTTANPSPASGSYGVYLDDYPIDGVTYGSFITAQNGSLNIWAANEVQVGWSGASAGVGVVNLGALDSITTWNGGNVNVTAKYGDVNTGSNPNGFDYQGAAPYSTVDPSLGGISTAAGGNVTIAAGGNVISYLPSGSTSVAADDGGTGAFGPEPGNVAITAGQNVYGHYVLANGVGTITAGLNVGASAGDPFALSLIDGGWNVNAPNGYIYLQEVRNPNGDFNNLNAGRGNSPGKYLFTYNPQAYIDLAAYAVDLTGLNVPRPYGDVPMVYPPIVDITAGAGGVTLENNVALFPSLYQNLDVTTTDGGDLSAPLPPSPTSPPIELLMSDSSSKQWVSGDGYFTDQYLGSSSAIEPADNPNPALISVSGSMENLYLITTKATAVTVGQDMDNCGFSGQNLSANDVTSISVAGEISNPSPYSYANNVAIPGLPATDLLPGMGESWDDIFTLALNPTAITSLQVPNLLPSQWLSYIYLNASSFGTTFKNGQWISNNPGFAYNPATGQLVFEGQMSSATESALDGNTITVLQLMNGVPETYVSTGQPGTVAGQTYFKTTTVSWAPASAITTLYNESNPTQGPPPPSLADEQLGYRIGGPGQFDIAAGSISLGNCEGILSCGVSDPNGGFDRYANLAAITVTPSGTPDGASLNVTVSGDLDMLTSTIADLGGGNVNIISTGGSMDLGSEGLFNSNASSLTGIANNHLSFGVYTTGGGDVTVSALGDIDINGSRIATYNGGNIYVESLTGNVNVGSGSDDLNTVFVAFVNPATGNVATYAEDAFGSGIVANTLVPPKAGEPYPSDAATVPGNITVITPEGSIVGGQAGIIQEALDGSITAGPTVDLAAGTFPSGSPGEPGYSPGYPGNIDFGDSGVIGGTINLTANGNISGQVISRQNSTINAAQSFSGTLLSGGSATVSAGGSISGTIIGVGGADVSGASVSADVLGQNVSVNGGASQSTLGTATATAATQAAAQQANSQAQQQTTGNDTDQDDKNKKKKPQVQKVGRVTVLLSSATPRQ